MAGGKPEVPEAPAETMRRAEKNVVLIGVKPIMNYVIACVTVFNAEGKDVCVKAKRASNQPSYGHCGTAKASVCQRFNGKRN